MSHQEHEAYPRHKGPVHIFCNQVGTRRANHHCANACPQVEQSHKIERGNSVIALTCILALQFRSCSRYDKRILLPWLAIRHPFEQTGERIGQEEGEYHLHYSSLVCLSARHRGTTMNIRSSTDAPVKDSPYRNACKINQLTSGHTKPGMMPTDIDKWQHVELVLGKLFDTHPSLQWVNVRACLEQKETTNQEDC